MSSANNQIHNENDTSEDALLSQAIQSSLEPAQSAQDALKEDDILLDEAIRSSLQDGKTPLKEKVVEKTKVNNPFINHLWELAEESIEPLIYSRCQINVNAKLADKEVTFIIDTGAQTNVMTLDVATKLGLTSFIDTNFKGKMHGVGVGEIVGIIPYIEVKFGDVICPTNFFILSSGPQTGPDKQKPLDILIGFPFMMFYKMKLDFNKSKMTIMNKDIDIIIKEF